MNILSLDMSTRRTGWAIFENEKLKSYNLIEIAGKDTDERTTYMYDKIQELITTHKIDVIVCEDVPVAVHSNLDVGKNLCVLQGCLLAIAHSNNIPLKRESPTAWRCAIGILESEYICDSCGYTRRDFSGSLFKICPNCGEKSAKKLHKNQLNDRFALKKRAIDYANKTFNLDLKYISLYSKKNQDDIAEAILVGYAYLKKEKKV